MYVNDNKNINLFPIQLCCASPVTSIIDNFVAAIVGPDGWRVTEEFFVVIAVVIVICYIRIKFPPNVPGDESELFVKDITLDGVTIDVIVDCVVVAKKFNDV